MSGIVYQIKCENNGKVYIGQAQSPQRLKLRWSKHKTELRKHHHHSIKLQRAWDKYGEDSFIFEILESDIPLDLLTHREQYYMDSTEAYTNGYNSCQFAACTRGYKPTPESIAKRVAKVKGMFVGRKLSEETKKKIRAARALQISTQESRKKVGDALRGRKAGPNPKKGWGKGRVVPQETKDKISATLKGRKLSEEVVQHMKDAQNRPEVKAKHSKRLSEAHREKLSESRKASEFNGLNHPARGKRSEESKQRMRDAALKRWAKIKKGEEHE